jgi:hypothetical protein
MTRRVLWLAVFFAATVLLVRDADLALSMCSFVQDKVAELKLATNLN